jgi:hypothetical protein
MFLLSPVQYRPTAMSTPWKECLPLLAAEDEEATVWRCWGFPPPLQLAPLPPPLERCSRCSDTIDELADDDDGTRPAGRKPPLPMGSRAAVSSPDVDLRLFSWMIDSGF